jgi:hypothetical protein
MPKEIEINYDADPPFNQKVRDAVDEILRKCVSDLVITWVHAQPENDKLGKDGADKWRVKVKSDFPYAAGCAGGNVINLNLHGIRNDAVRVAEGDYELALANTLCHELVVHVIVNRFDHWGCGEEPDEVDRDALTHTLYRVKGKLSDNKCEEFKKALGL